MKKSRWRLVPTALAVVLAAGLLALAAAWVWAGSEGSLARVLHWVGAYQPLTAERVTGSLRGGGTVGRLAWAQDGLRVEVDEAELRWRPAALLARTLHIDRLAAGRIAIDDQRPAGEPSDGPPESLALPLTLRIDALQVDALRWAGPPALALNHIAGRFDFDGARHQLDIDHAEFEGGRYRAHAALGAQAPIRLDAALAGAWAAPLPETDAPLPLTLQATLRGPLTELQAQAEVQATPAGSAPAIPALPTFTSDAAPEPTGGLADGPAAHARARITPWGAQPLPEAHARLHALDVGALWAQAPRTRLSGQFDLAPLAGDAPGWSLAADLSNDASGPWDQRALPLQTLQAKLDWMDGAATVHSLHAQLAGGTLQAQGRWAAPQASAADGPWQLDARLEGINPAALHTQLAAFPLDGTARASGQGEAIDFDAALQARPQQAPARAGNDPLARELQALRLRDLAATGRWADGTLALSRLRLRTADAELSGSARLQPGAQGGQAQLALDLPGSALRLEGELWPDRGAGQLQLNTRDAAQTLAWARRLPLATAALAGWQASGQTTLGARWRGGWRDPELHARLNVPRAELRPPADSADGADGAEAPPIQLRSVDLALDGRLAAARLQASGHVAQGARTLELQLSASGGRTTPDAPLAASGWRGEFGPWTLALSEPALGPGRWHLASTDAVPVEGTAAPGARLRIGAGRLRISAPAGDGAPAQLAWGPIDWQDGALTSTGRLSGLPLQWAEQVAGDALAQAGLSGDVVFDGDWDLALGPTLRLRASLARAAGDLRLDTTDEETGVAARVAAGLREARLDLSGSGSGTALQARLAWDSAQAGRLNAELSTELRAPDPGAATGWAWPESAPLRGQVRAELPQISAWSVLAPPGWRLRGSVSADVQVDGTRAAPQLHGSLNAERLALRSVVDGVQLGRGRLRARLDGTRLRIDEFTLHGPGRQGAGGTLTASGEAGWIDGRAQARLNATLERLRASVRADRQATVSGQLQAALDGRAVRADGRLHVDQARIELPDESAPALGGDVVVHGADGRQARGADAPAVLARPPAARRAESDQAAAPLTAEATVQIDLGDDLRIQGLGIDTRLAGTLQLTASGPITAAPRLTGSIRTEGGSFHAYSQNLNIARGLITFSGAADNPALDIVALRPNFTSDQRVGVQVAGTALLPRVRLYSEPQLSDNQALAWLLLGRPAPDTGAEAAMLQSAALALLGGREGRGLAAQFGLDELSFSGGGDGEVGSASVMLGKRLSDRLYAAYEHSIAGASGTLLIFYELSRRWSLRGQAGVDSAVDLIYKLSFD